MINSEQVKEGMIVHPSKVKDCKTFEESMKEKEIEFKNHSYEEVSAMLDGFAALANDWMTVWVPTQYLKAKLYGKYSHSLNAFRPLTKDEVNNHDQRKTSLLQRMTEEERNEYKSL